MAILTFQELSDAILKLIEDNKEIKTLLLKPHPGNYIPEDEILTVEACSKLLDLSIPTIYSLISKKEIPYMKRSKRVYFIKNDILNYLKEGRIRTTYENISAIESLMNNETEK